MTKTATRRALVLTAALGLGAAGLSIPREAEAAQSEGTLQEPIPTEEPGITEPEEVDVVVVHPGRNGVTVISGSYVETTQSCLDGRPRTEEVVQLRLTPLRDYTLGDGTTSWTLAKDTEYCLVVLNLRGGGVVEVFGTEVGGSALGGSLLPATTSLWSTDPSWPDGPIEVTAKYELTSPNQIRFTVASPEKSIDLVLVAAGP